MTGSSTICLMLLGAVALTQAQVPGFGGCPDFVAMPDFDMTKFLGTWYETERYVNIFEAGSRCVKTNYTKAVDGRFLVASEIMNRFTGVKRVLEGEIKLIVKGTKSELNVRYPNLPIPYDTQYTVLDTNYDEYAVVWACSSLGIVNTQNAWILTREKLPSGTSLQKAYGVLDKYKLSRYFFSKTDQNDCHIAEAANDANNAVDGNETDGNDAVEQTADGVTDGVYKNADASPSPAASPEASPVAEAAPVPAADAAPVAVVAAVVSQPASDAAAAPAVAVVAVEQPSPVPAAVAEEPAAPLKSESPAVPAEAAPAAEASKTEVVESNVVAAQEVPKEQPAVAAAVVVKETIVQSAPLPKAHHASSVHHNNHHHHSTHHSKISSKN
uniref:Apolipoprotein D n=1 Tax=Cacopsylla melanoneura TaxID=428564 RepID=A0A8D8PMK5_9HEMI